MADKPGGYKWDNPIIAREDAEASKPALRNALDYLQRLPEQLRRFGKLIEAFAGPGAEAFLNARGLSVALRGYALKTTAPAGAFVERYTIGPRGKRSGDLSGIQNVTADLVGVSFLAHRILMNEGYACLVTASEGFPRNAITVNPGVSPRNPDAFLFAGTNAAGAAVNIGSASTVAVAWEFAVIGTYRSAS